MVVSFRDGLASRAAGILRENDRGGWTKAAPELYPHQWSWDAAFVTCAAAFVAAGVCGLAVDATRPIEGEPSNN